MSFCCQSEPKRTSMAKATNARPFLSRVSVDSSTRTRRSRGGGRSREKRLPPSRLASGFTSPSSIRCCAQLTSDSSAEATEARLRTNGHKSSQRRDFTGHTFREREASERQRAAERRPHAREGGRA